MAGRPPCPLCALVENGVSAGLAAVWADDRLRVVRVLDAPEFPAFYRVIWAAHVAEFSDMSADDRLHCMSAVATVEQVLRRLLSPTKINLAALGNMVPHLHWHVIARFEGDSHFPQPIWGPQQRPSTPEALALLAARLPEVDAELRLALGA
jgi:diadenosine tetraphosphate (Ap4A) HIT family hydrolase